MPSTKSLFSCLFVRQTNLTSRCLQIVSATATGPPSSSRLSLPRLLACQQRRQTPLALMIAMLRAMETPCTDSVWISHTSQLLLSLPARFVGYYRSIPSPASLARVAESHLSSQSQFIRIYEYVYIECISSATRWTNITQVRASPCSITTVSVRKVHGACYGYIGVESLWFVHCHDSNGRAEGKAAVPTFPAGGRLRLS
jgi:hypothetical protein